jgi:gluconokinase
VIIIALQFASGKSYAEAIQVSNNGFPPMVIMGVSGSGKSTVGALLGSRLGVRFIDGDDLHPAANKEKMGAGIPLDDHDRRPWLQEIGRTLAAYQEEEGGVIVACSALKRRYRDLLREHAPDVVFLHLQGSADTLAARMAARSHEFMPATLLASQLEALEPLGTDERHVLLDVRQSPSELADKASAALEARTTPAGK